MMLSYQVLFYQQLVHHSHWINNRHDVREAIKTLEVWTAPNKHHGMWDSIEIGKFQCHKIKMLILSRCQSSNTALLVYSSNLVIMIIYIEKQAFA